MDPRLDLSPLDPGIDPDWEGTLSDAIMSRVRAGTPLSVSTAGETQDAIAALLSIARPALLAASILVTAAMVESSVHWRAEASSPSTQSRSSNASSRFPLASAVGLVGPWASWVEENRSPSPAEVLAAARGY